MSTIKSGQTVVATSAGVVYTTDTQKMLWINVRSLASNAEMALGTSGVTLANGYLLLPGEAHRLGACDMAQLYVIGTAGDNLSWVGCYTS